MRTNKIAIFVSIVTCFVLLTSSSIPSQITVLSNVAWTVTDYTINVGDRLVISSSGEAIVLAETKCSPNGVENNAELIEKLGVLKTANFGSLIGKIGENGEPFYVGENLNVIATSKGILYLGINDNDLKDNTGEFYSIVTITPASENTKTE